MPTNKLKTIEEVGQEIYQVILNMPWLNAEQKKDKILSIVIGQEDRECLNCEGKGAIGGGTVKADCETHQVYGLAVCPWCHGKSVFKHPITIRDAIERVK